MYQWCLNNLHAFQTCQGCRFILVGSAARDYKPWQLRNLIQSSPWIPAGSRRNPFFTRGFSRIKKVSRGNPLFTARFRELPRVAVGKISIAARSRDNPLFNREFPWIIAGSRGNFLLSGGFSCFSMMYRGYPAVILRGSSCGFRDPAHGLLWALLTPRGFRVEPRVYRGSPQTPVGISWISASSSGNSLSNVGFPRIAAGSRRNSILSASVITYSVIYFESSGLPGLTQELRTHAYCMDSAKRL